MIAENKFHEKFNCTRAIFSYEIAGQSDQVSNSKTMDPPDCFDFTISEEGKLICLGDNSDINYDFWEASYFVEDEIPFDQIDTNLIDMDGDHHSCGYYGTCPFGVFTLVNCEFAIT